MACRRNPGGAVHIEANVIVRTERPFPGVDTNPDPELPTQRPVVFR